MKLISFLKSGTPSFGVVVNDKVLDLGPLLGSSVADLKSAIEQNLFARIHELLLTHQPNLNFAELTLLPVIPNPDKIVWV